MFRQETGTDPCLHCPLCYTRFLLPLHCHAVCGLPELVSRTCNLICTICNDWRQLCGVLLNIYCQEYGKVIYLTCSKLPRCELLVAGTLRAFPPFLALLLIGKPPHLTQVSMVCCGWEHHYCLCAQTHDSGVHQEVSTTAVWRGIRHLWTIWSALSPWSCSPSQLFSSSELFPPCGWQGRGQVSRCRMREMEPWNVWTGQRVELAQKPHGGQDLLLHPPGQGHWHTTFWVSKKARSLFQLVRCSGVRQGALG